ncbi:MAG: pentapeptide repeat-containing protein [Cyclobacteriaceae bacterium]
MKRHIPYITLASVLITTLLIWTKCSVNKFELEDLIPELWGLVFELVFLVLILGSFERRFLRNQKKLNLLTEIEDLRYENPKSKLTKIKYKHVLREIGLMNIDRLPLYELEIRKITIEPIIENIQKGQILTFNGADFKFSIFKDVHFNRVDFENADFSGAILKNITFSNCMLGGCNFDKAEKLINLKFVDCSAKKTVFGLRKFKETIIHSDELIGHLS